MDRREGFLNPRLGAYHLYLFLWIEAVCLGEASAVVPDTDAVEVRGGKGEERALDG